MFNQNNTSTHTIPTWPCDHPGCKLHSIPLSVGCDFCGENLCEIHDVEPHHICKSSTAEENDKRQDIVAAKYGQAYLDRIRSFDFKKAAEALRPGHSCIVTLPETYEEIRFQGGATNYHVPIDFDDGIQWLARIRRMRLGSQHPVTVRRVMDSEILTMQVMHHAGIKIPKVFVPGSDNDSGLKYFFIEKLKGAAHDPPYSADPNCSPRYYKRMSPEFANNYFNDLADFHIKLSALKFDSIGMLETKEGKVAVGPLFPQTRSQVVRTWFGPFKSTADRYIAQIDHVLDQVAKKLFVPPDSEKVVLLHSALKTMIMNSPVLREEPGEYYISHQDPFGDHIMTTEDGHITGLIDWEWAITSTKAEAFAGDMSGHAVDYERLSMAYHVRGRPDLAECVQNGALYTWLRELVGARFTSDYSWDSFKGVAMILAGDDLQNETMEGWCEKLGKVDAARG